MDVCEFPSDFPLPMVERWRYLGDNRIGHLRVAEEVLVRINGFELGRGALPFQTEKVSLILVQGVLRKFVVVPTYLLLKMCVTCSAVGS